MTTNENPNLPWRAAISRPLDIEPFKPISAAIGLELAAASVCGTLRPYNTDHYLAVRIGRLQETLVTSLAEADLPPRFEEYAYALLVADGLGEQWAGSRASRVALSALAHMTIRYGHWNVRVGPETPADIAERGEFFYRQLNEAVLRGSRTHVQLSDMATSLTALYVVEGELFFTHVGHSRAFLFREGSLVQLTTDQTLEQQRRGASGPTAIEGTRSDLSHVVTGTIGGKTTGPDVETEHVKLASGDRLLLCTNGLTDVVSEELIADALALRRGPAEDCQRLIELARDEHNPDDATVMVGDYTVRQRPD